MLYSYNQNKNEIISGYYANRATILKPVHRSIQLPNPHRPQITIHSTTIATKRDRDQSLTSKKVSETATRKVAAAHRKAPRAMTCALLCLTAMYAARG